MINDKSFTVPISIVMRSAAKRAAYAQLEPIKILANVDKKGDRGLENVHPSAYSNIALQQAAFAFSDGFEVQLRYLIFSVLHSHLKATIEILDQILN